MKESHKSNRTPEPLMMGDAIKEHGQGRGRAELRWENSEEVPSVQPSASIWAWKQLILNMPVKKPLAYPCWRPHSCVASPSCQVLLGNPSNPPFPPPTVKNQKSGFGPLGALSSQRSFHSEPFIFLLSKLDHSLLQ